MTRLFHIPNTLSRWPYPRRIHPDYEEVSAESAAWLRSFHPFSPEKQVAFDKCKFGLFAALTYPNVDKDHFRSACDLMNVFFVFDDQTDIVDAAHARVLADIAIDAVRHPDCPRPNGEPVLGEITRQFWARACVNSTASGRTRFEVAWMRYVEGVVGQAEDRDAGRLRTTEEYLELRRFTIGASPSYAFAVLKVDLPLEVSELPILRELSEYITDIIILDNDICSYPKEYAAGDITHNMITLVMNEKHLDLDAAVAWVAGEHARRVDGFLALLPEASALSFGSREVDEALSAYLDHLVNWPRGLECWSFECERYFGQDGLKVATERLVEVPVTVPGHSF
ncbi:hypothetical protein VTO73DRAFT_7733 [Trametes versicolor]